MFKRSPPLKKRSCEADCCAAPQDPLLFYHNEPRDARNESEIIRILFRGIKTLDIPLIFEIIER